MKRSRVTMNKRKDIEKIQSQCVFESAQYFGPYTQIKARYGSIVGYGLARKSKEDSYDNGVGQIIAKNRAICSIIYKIAKKTPHHPLMG